MSEPADPTPGNLGTRFLRGSVYLGAGNWFTYALNFALNLVLARLLGPEAFGLYAFVFAVNELLNLVGAFSVDLSVLQSKEVDQEFYDSAFFLSLILGLTGFLFALVASPILSHVRNTDAGWFIVIFGGCRMAALIAQIHLVRLERQLRYGLVATIGIVSGIIPSLAAVGMALLGANAWSLVGRDAFAAVLNLAMAALASGYHFRRQVTRHALRQIMAFARPMFGLRVVEVLLMRSDRIALGYVLGDRALGLYHQARYIAESGLLAVRPVTRLTLNLYSRLRDDPDRLTRSYDIVNYFLVRAIFAGSAVLLTFPEQTIRLLLGEEWIQAYPTLRWLAIYSGLLPVVENLKVLMVAQGRVREFLGVRLAQFGVMIPGVAISVAVGSVEGVAATVTIASAAGMALAIRANRKLLRAPLTVLLGVPALAVAVCYATFSAAAAYGSLDALPEATWPFLVPLLFGAIIGTLERSRLWSEFLYLRRLLTA